LWFLCIFYKFHHGVALIYEGALCLFLWMLASENVPGRDSNQRPVEYWMIYRGPGFLDRWPPSPAVSKLDRQRTGRPRKRDNLLTGEKGIGGEGGAKSYDCKKAWSSIHHSLLSAVTYLALDRHANNIYLRHTQCCSSFSNLCFLMNIPYCWSSFYLNTLSGVQHENCHTEYEEQCHIAEGETEETHYGN